MHIFLKEKMIYPAVCTSDRKHWILVGCTEEQLKQFEQDYNVKRGEEDIWVVHHCENRDLYQIALGSLPLRLSPMFGDNQMPYENFFQMHKYFYRNNKMDVMVKGVVFNEEGTENPFKKANTDPQTGFMCLSDVKLHG